MPVNNSRPTTNEDLFAQIAATQADVRNICNTLDGIKAYMSKQIDQHTTTIGSLMVIERVQNDMKENMTKYTDDCTRDRDSQSKRISTNETDISDIKAYQNRQLKTAGFVGGFVAFLTAGGIKILDKIFT